ncbi:MAG: sigma-70 family RNA polymerase sigma factor [Dehalococcoidia bacterium]
MSPSPAEETALDADVILQAQQGDPDAFAELVRVYEETAFRVAYLIVRNEADARDAAQEAFVRAHGALKRFDVRKPFRPWFLRIVTNVALNRARANRRRQVVSERYEQTLVTMASAPSVEEQLEAAEQARRVWQAVGELDPQDQTVLYLRYFLDASERETAQAIGRAPGTVKSRLHRVLRRLRKVIDTQYPDLLWQVAASEQKETRP